METVITPQKSLSQISQYLKWDIKRDTFNVLIGFLLVYLGGDSDIVYKILMSLGAFIFIISLTSILGSLFALFYFYHCKQWQAVPIVFRDDSLSIIYYLQTNDTFKYTDFTSVIIDENNALKLVNNDIVIFTNSLNNYTKDEINLITETFKKINKPVQIKKQKKVIKEVNIKEIFDLCYCTVFILLLAIYFCIIK